MDAMLYRFQRCCFQVLTGNKRLLANCFGKMKIHRIGTTFAYVECSCLLGDMTHAAKALPLRFPSHFMQSLDTLSQAVRRSK
jgi:hypothetical protein